MADVRDADLPPDLETVRALWLEYLTWGKDELEAMHGFRLPVQETVENDVATIAKFQPPDGRLLLAFEDDMKSARPACAGSHPILVRSSACGGPVPSPGRRRSRDARSIDRSGTHARIYAHAAR